MKALARFAMGLCPLLLTAVFARAGGAQIPQIAPHTMGASISGIVRDSLARLPLADATVQLVAADNPARFGVTVVSDSAGRFTLNDVPVGRYMLGFFHPILDSLGVQAPLHELYVDSREPLHTDLAVPSAERLRSAICGVDSSRSPGAVVIGFVRNASDGAPAAGVTVTGEWMEYSIGKQGVERRMPHVVSTTGDNGWFAMCNIPSPGTITLLATRAGDSTDLIELEIPAAVFVRRELFLGTSQTVAVGGETAVSNAGGPTRPAPVRSVHLGDGRLSGTVMNARGFPLAGAQVNITGGPETRTNENGEWFLANAPSGSRMLEIHALGYYPHRRQVHVIQGAPVIDVTLLTLDAVLDTVRVRAQRGHNRDRNGFAERSRTSVGRYLTPRDIAKRPAEFASDIFRRMPGVRVGIASDTLATDMDLVLVRPADQVIALDRRLLIHGISGDWCAAAIYIDGIFMPHLGSDDVDAWVRPKDISGVEIYSEATVPTEFRQERSGCGSIVIWRK